MQRVVDRNHRKRVGRDLARNRRVGRRYGAGVHLDVLGRKFFQITRIGVVQPFVPDGHHLGHQRGRSELARQLWAQQILVTRHRRLHQVGVVAHDPRVDAQKHDLAVFHEGLGPGRGIRADRRLEQALLLDVHRPAHVGGKHRIAAFHVGRGALLLELDRHGGADNPHQLHLDARIGRVECRHDALMHGRRHGAVQDDLAFLARAIEYLGPLRWRYGT